MAKYNYKYLSEEMVKEMDVLLAGEHGATLTAWSYECARASKLGLVEGTLIVAAVGAAAGIAIYVGEKFGKKIVQVFKNKKQDKKKLEDHFVESE